MAAAAIFSRLPSPSATKAMPIGVFLLFFSIVTALHDAALF
jgi:hypothetical protein